jgi:hypothetical protein
MLDRRQDKHDNTITICIVTIVIGFIGYCGDNAYRGILSSIAEGKVEGESHYKSIYQKMSTISEKIDDKIKCVNQNLRLVKGSEVC